MKQRMTWAAVLGIATVGLTGCPMTVATLDQDTFLGLPTSQRPASGDKLPGSMPTNSGGGSGGGSSSGGTGGQTQPGTGGTFGESGTNPSQLSLANGAALQVEPLYPSSAQARITISNAGRGLLAAAGLVDLSASQVVQPALSVSWPSTSNLLSFGPRLATSSDQALDREDAFKQALRQRLRSEVQQNVRGVQAVRGLISDPVPSVKILTPLGTQNRTLWIYDTQTVSINGRATRFAIAVDSADKDAVFGSGSTLRATLESTLRTQILPTLQAMYGPIPNQAEAEAADLQFQDDVTYFIFSSQLEDNLLGYFNPGDFLDSASSNQIRALYLSADAAIEARTNTVARNDLMGTIAHELQHLLFAWNRVKATGRNGYLAEAQGGADVWLDEGLAMLAAAKSGFGLEAEPGKEATYVGPSLNLAGHVKQFLSRPGDYSMIAFHQNAKVSGETSGGNPAPAYGMAYLFAQYMVDQLGVGVIDDILSSTKNGLTISSGGSFSGKHDPVGILNDALGRRNVKLSTLFASFATAVALDGSNTLDASDATLKQRFEIRGINLRQSPFQGLTLTGPALAVPSSTPPRPYGIRLIDSGALSSASTLQLSGNSNVATRLILLP
jgi:hypothetical protein